MRRLVKSLVLEKPAHIRLPGGLRVKSVDAASEATVEPDGSGIRWKTPPKATVKFQATVGT
jgi:hypothetical protein